MIKELTGKFYHKKTRFGLVLMVEEEIDNYVFPRCKFRKAKQEDLASKKLKLNK